MASPVSPPRGDGDEINHDDARNPYTSQSRWRHAESSAYAKYEQGRGAAQHSSHHHHHHHHHNGPIAREADAQGGGVSDLADFLNKSRVEPPEKNGNGHGSDRPTSMRFKPVIAGAEEARAATGHAEDAPAAESAIKASSGPPPDGKEISVGPLINYRRMEGRRWVGSVLVVTVGGGRRQGYTPTLELRRAVGEEAGEGGSGGGSKIEGICLYSDPRNTFWRFDITVEMEGRETKWEYELPGLRFASRTKPRVNAFYVPAVTESMRIMFHSCNGFSVGTDEEAFSGACLWNDVMRKHRERPFHVMIGGGDQIYNDGIRVQGPLRKWTAIGNPKKRREYPFPESLREECDDYYLKNYIRWYGTEPFAAANGQIPQINIWDDHDIIDGFGSYVNEFMKCDVFRGIGGVAHKYYMLFQHHLAPPPSTYTSDAVHPAVGEEGQGVDPNQFMTAYVHPKITESGYINGPKPGPYVAEHSHNLYARLGARIAFVGIDARTERTRHQINYPETYDAIFARLKEEFTAAANSDQPLKHLILLLGVPIAYPRLTWLENIFSSPVIAPIKLLNRRIGLGGTFFNSFDGSVDLLDDLDDHYTARTHKKERNRLIERFQALAAEFSIRITILSGDVHLAALGRFYSNPKLNIPTENDYRYIANVVSSAIVNKPPPAAVANLLARRNKIHHLNHETDETLLKLFDKDPGNSSKTSKSNNVTMPSRNFAIITENSPTNNGGQRNGGASGGGWPLNSHQVVDQNHLFPPTNGGGAAAGLSSQVSLPHSAQTSSGIPRPKDARLPIGAGEVNCGSKHKAAVPGEHGRGSDGSLDVSIQVEIDQHDGEGRTEGYGLTIPALEYRGEKPVSVVGSVGRGSRRSVRSGRSH
ncbi:hypothetical protein B0T21DRAFT_394637 [Apiosordaria backusii]|uniref:PhoD-like phosphatase domain-containing protein n=1 Tax=Apiosordaria backusii TaxID=314023 RepID=A0AA40B858_9PEZI|nr:hypothetical protein B0T21DRAFT_394637 [Apiosordaria backusii]